MRNMNRSGMNRRQFIGAVGAGLAGAAMFGSSVARANTPLPPLRVAVPFNGQLEKAIAKEIAKRLGYNPVISVAPPDAYAKLEAGNFDIVFSGKPWSLVDYAYNITSGPAYYFDYNSDAYCYAIRNGDDLLQEQVALALWFMIGDGTYQNIFKAPGQRPANADPAKCRMIVEGGNLYVIPGAF